MRHRDPNSYWLSHGRDVGIRCFPRAGSTTIMETYSRSNNFGEFCVKPKKVCVVRDPWERLMSVWIGMVRSGNFQQYSFVKSDHDSLPDFLFWLVDQDPDVSDPHITPMWAFLKGWWHPQDHELMTMEGFFRNPPFGLRRPQIHKNKTTYPNHINVPKRAYGKWFDAFGEKDYELFYRAQKSPLETGGKQAADNGHDQQGR